MFAQRGTLLATSPALAAAHAEAGQEGESQQVEESEHHLVCLVRVADQVSSDNIDCDVDNWRLGQVYELDSSAASPHWVADCGDSSFPCLALQAARAYMDRWPHHCTLSPDTGAIVSRHNTGCGPVANIYNYS